LMTRSYISSVRYKAVALLLFFLSVAFAGPLPTACANEEAWQHIGDYEGVALYRSVYETEGVLPFKAVAVLDIPFDKIVMALVDAERKADWAPKLKATAIHTRISPNRFEYSEYYQTPWPFKDREFLLAGTVEYRQDRIVFAAENSTNGALARKDHLRANIQTLTFDVVPISAGRTEVAFTFSGDLGGWIPAFVKTIIQKKWPVRFIQSMKQYIASNDSLETERYRSLEKTTVVFQQP